MVLGGGESPSHLRHLLFDRSELARFLDYLGHAKFLEEARAIQSVFGSYARNIELFDRAHLTSLNKARNVVAVLAAAVLVGSFFTGPIYCGLAVLLFLVPVAFGLPESAKNNNITHVHTVMLNLCRWHQDDPSGCAEYCRDTRPELKTVHDLLVALGAGR